MQSKNPTLSQKKIIESTGRTILKSCPGSGKTFVVANKVLREIQKWEHKNRGIALLSFTNVANNEIKKQIQNMTGINEIDYPHYIGTLDSFISRFIFLPFGHLIMKCATRPSIIQDYSLNINAFADRVWKFQCYKNGCNSEDFYIDIDGTIKNTRKELADCPIKSGRPCITFKKYCYKNGFATHTDAIAISLRVLQNYPQIGNLLAKKFPMLIIDEAQDTSAYQMKIIEKLSEYGVSNILLIGDPDQAIYEWRDADPSVFLDKYKDVQWKPEELNENFRCSQKICNATKIFSTLTAISLSAGESANSDFKPKIIKYNPDSKKEIIDHFLDICKQRGIEITPEKVAVLVRGRSGLVGKDYSQVANLWQSQTAKLLSEASYERDYNSVTKATNLVNKALFEIFISSKANSNSTDLETIETFMSASKWKRIVYDFCKSMPSSDMPLRVWTIQITSLIERFAMKYTLNILLGSEIKIKTRDKKLKDFHEQPVKNFYVKSFTGNYLNSTIHAVKGCTFEAVLLLIGKNGKLTSNMLNTKPIESEEIRTAYVAMTRAKEILIVAVPNTIKKKSLIRFSDEHWDINI